MLKKNFAELTELKHILRKTQQFFEEVCDFLYSLGVNKKTVIPYP